MADNILPITDRLGRVRCPGCLLWTAPADLQPGVGVFAGLMVCAQCAGGLRLLQAVFEVDG